MVRFVEKHINITVLTTGPLFSSVLLMLTSMRNMVTRRAMRPGTLSAGIRNPMKEVIVSRPVGR